MHSNGFDEAGNTLTLSRADRRSEACNRVKNPKTLVPLLEKRGLDLRDGTLQFPDRQPRLFPGPYPAGRADHPGGRGAVREVDL